MDIFLYFLCIIGGVFCLLYSLTEAVKIGVIVIGILCVIGVCFSYHIGHITLTEKHLTETKTYISDSYGNIKFGSLMIITVKKYKLFKLSANTKVEVYAKRYIK